MHTPQLNNEQIEKAVLMEALANSDMGLYFLQWLCKLTGWERSTMSNEDSAKRDIWINIRKHIPVEKLALIEHEGVRVEQQLIRDLLRTEPVFTEEQE